MKTALFEAEIVDGFQRRRSGCRRQRSHVLIFPFGPFVLNFQNQVWLLSFLADPESVGFQLALL
jgi:hypothetical protein